jgi:tetratricopeptide (TPR) repeat protein
MARIPIPVEVSRRWLDELDRKRIDDPLGVVKAVEKVVRKTDTRLFSKLYSIYGAALRRLNRLQEAEHAYWLGKKIACSTSHLPDEAEITQRQTWVLAARGRFPDAVSKSTLALSLHTIANDRGAIGRVLVDQGILFHYLSQSQRSDLFLERARDYLVKDDSINFATSVMYEALNAQASKKWRVVLTKVKVLKQYDLGPTFSIKVRWIEVRSLIGANLLEEAESQLRQIVEYCFSTQQLLDAALGAAELARILIAQGKTVEVVEIAEILRPHVYSMKEGGIAEAAATDLYRSAATGRLSLTIVEKVVNDIKKVRLAQREVVPTS